MNTTFAKPTKTLRPVLLALPLVFATLGIVVRYLAYAANVASPSLAGFAEGICRWDCFWYIRLAESGYDPFPVPSMGASANWAFFPLYPMLVGAFQRLSGLPTIWVATCLSITLSMIAVRLAYPLLRHDLRAYALLAAFVLAGPFSVYFTTFYTETLFFLLVVCVLVALRHRNYLLAGGFAALLSATRIVGVFMVLSIILTAWLDYRDKGGAAMGFIPTLLRRPDLLLAIFVAPFGLFAFMAFLHLHVGDALAFSHVQRAWGRFTDNPLTHLWTALSNIPSEGWGIRGTQLLGLSALAGTAMAVVMILRRQHAAALFCLICIYLPMTTGTVSMLRFVVGLAPVTITAVTLLARWRWLFAALLVLIPALGYLGTQGWIRGWLTLV
jgi:hypothetical protein